MIKHSIAIAFLLAFMLIGTIIGARADNVLIPNAALLDLAKDLCGYGIKPNYEHRSSRAHANTGDPNGPIEAYPLMSSHAR
jgi:hypothetical protein